MLVAPSWIYIWNLLCALKYQVSCYLRAGHGALSSQGDGSILLGGVVTGRSYGNHNFFWI